MKKFKHLLSLVLVPALTMQAGMQAGGTGTCSSGGGSTPASLNIPTAVLGIQTINSVTAATTYNFTVGTTKGSTGSIQPDTNTLFTYGGVYGVWCTQPSNTTVPGGGNGVRGLSSPTATYTPYNYSTYSTSTAGASFGFAPTKGQYDPSNGQYDLYYNGTTLYTLAQEWNAVNWLLNNLNGSSGETAVYAQDIQDAIWQLLHPETGIPYVTTVTTPNQVPNAASAKLYLDALQHTDFIPATGQYVAVLMVPTTPTGAAQQYQGFIVPFMIPCSSATGSAITLTKTASVTSANAFQLIKYTYTVTNTGSTTLGNIVITDDNGTPGYTEDDIQIPVPGTLGPKGSSTSSYTTSINVYLPISLFYQSGNQAAFDTLIPQVPTTPANSLLLTYLIDSDVTDNTYGTGASAGWAGVGGHTFQEELGNYAEFAFYDSRGTAMGTYSADYLSAISSFGGSSTTFPSGYGSAPEYTGSGASNTVNPKQVLYNTSTLADNLNGYSKFYDDTTNSPVGDSNWQTISGYKVIVNTQNGGIFGMFGMGSVSIKKNYMNAVETAYSGKCSRPISGSYCPTIVSSKVTGTAYVCATVCGCSTVIHACARTCVTLNGCAQPTCYSAPSHTCQAPKCQCTCAECQAGHCSQCQHTGCTDSVCHNPTNNCPHYTVVCKQTGHTYCW